MSAQDQAPGLAGLHQALDAAGLDALADPLIDSVRRAWRETPHGDWAKWRDVLNNFASLTPSSCDFDNAVVRIGERQDCNDETRAHLKHLLLQLRPWRKGPFTLFGVEVDAEWRSERKWARLAEHVSLRNRRVLDVGCGNGYYLWRMLGDGARLALGIDPARLFVAQFAALKNYCPHTPAFVLPLSSEQFAAIPGNGFDTVFSMGVLSHRRNPHTHLRELLAFARPGGELVVETLVITDSSDDSVLNPAGRYAKMRNVHAIPSPPVLEKWLQQSGAKNIQLLDISQTTPAEQRTTEWMQSQSLTDFLHPTDPTKTIEGHPAPQRAIFLCRRPE